MSSQRRALGCTGRGEWGRGVRTRPHTPFYLRIINKMVSEHAPEPPGMMPNTLRGVYITNEIMNDKFSKSKGAFD